MALALMRKQREWFWVSPNLRITVGRIRGDRVQLLIDAPRTSKVIRGELMRKMEQCGITANEVEPTTDHADRPVLLSRMLRDGRRAEAYLGPDNSIYLAIDGQRLKTLDLGNIVESVACIA